MSNSGETARAVLRAASDAVRREAGIDHPRAHLGHQGGEAEVDARLMDVAERVAATQAELPPIPQTGALRILLIVIFLAALLFLVTLMVARNEPFIEPLLVGQGGVFTALTGLASYMALIHKSAVDAYNARAADWIRTDAVVRVMREMSRGKPLDPEATAKLLDALRAVFPSRP